MKCAFVVRLGPKTNPRAHRLDGWVEEVDTGSELRFLSQDELLSFFNERFLAVANTGTDGSQQFGAEADRDEGR